MPGKIKVKILAGRNLPVMDRSGDTTDAYVEIKFSNTTYKTDVCRKSLNPQWNSEWYRFEVDDAELQDEPLQVRLMDHDTYSANDAIGKVYVNLNPLLLPGSPLAVKNIWTLEATMNSSGGTQAGAVMTGWIPVFDTMHGIRGEVNIIVKVELFSDCNKFRQSSCGVQFFYSANVPHGYHAQVIHGFVEELVVSDDPEYKWIDKIRTPRASNEARQTLFFKMSGEVQRKIGLKALDLGGNAVIGYVQNFDLEGESGIVARGIGTAVTLVKIQDISLIAPPEPSNIEDLTSFGLQRKNLGDLSESDDSLPLLANSPSHSPVPRSPINIHPTTVSQRFPKYEKSPKHQRRATVRLAEYRAAALRARQFSLQSGSCSAPSAAGPMRKGIGSSLSLAEDLISESSLKNMLALEDMRGEPTSNPFSRSFKNFRYLHQNILPKRVAQIKSKLADSFDDESDPDSSYSSTWSLAGSESNKSSIVDLRQSIRRKKLTHKKGHPSDGIAALLIRSVHTGFPLDSVKEDRETPAPSPVNFIPDTTSEYSDAPSTEPRTDDNAAAAAAAAPNYQVETSSEPLAIRTDLQDKIIFPKTKLSSKYASDISIPMISSSESDTSTSEDDDEPSESSTNYNILDETYSLIDPNSPDERKERKSPRTFPNVSKALTIHANAANPSILSPSSPIKIIKHSFESNNLAEIVPVREDDPAADSRRDFSLESSTDYNILDDISSPFETKFSQVSRTESMAQPDSAIVTFDGNVNNIDPSRVVETRLEKLPIFSADSQSDYKFLDDTESLVKTNLPADDDEIFQQVPVTSWFTVASSYDAKQRHRHSIKSDTLKDTNHFFQIDSPIPENSLSICEQTSDLEDSRDDFTTLGSIRSINTNELVVNLLDDFEETNTTSGRDVETSLRTGEKLDSRTDYNVLDDTCSMNAPSSFDDMNFNSMIEKSFENRILPEIAAVEMNLEFQMFGELAKPQIQTDFSFESQTERNLNSSTDYNVLEDTVEMDDSQKVAMKEIEKFSISDEEKNGQLSSPCKSSPAVKLPHLKFLPKQKHFDSVEDLDFVTSTPVEADVTPPDFSPIDKSPESPELKKWDFQSLPSIPKLETKACNNESRSMVDPPDLKIVEESREKQICPLGIVFDKVTTLSDSKNRNESEFSKDNNGTSDVQNLATRENSGLKNTRKSQKKVERTDTVIYKGPAKDREKGSTRTGHSDSVKSVKSKQSTSSAIPIVVAPPPEEKTTRLQVPIIQTTNINVQNCRSTEDAKNSQQLGGSAPREKKSHSEELAMSEKLTRKYRQHCMLDLMKTIETKMMMHHMHHERRDSTRSKQRKKRERMNASATPSPDSIHRTKQHRRRSRSRSPDRPHVHGRAGHVSTLTTHSFPIRNCSSLNLAQEPISSESSCCETSSKNNIPPPSVLSKDHSNACSDDKYNAESIICSETNWNNITPPDISITSNNNESNAEEITIDPQIIKTNSGLLAPKGSSEHPVFKSHSAAGSLELFGSCSSPPLTKNTNVPNMTDDLCVPCSQLTHRQQDEQPSSPLPTSSGGLPSSLGSKQQVTPNASSAKNNNTALPNMHRRSSDSDLSITPKGNSLAGSDRSMGGHMRPSTAIVRTMNQDTVEMLEYPFITMQQYPPGFVLNIGGLVSARSVKLLERITNLEEPEGRDAWWTEIRMEVRSHARALACNVVLGYKEEISICDDVCVLNASGTAAVINLLNANPDQENAPSRTIMTTSVESEREKSQAKATVGKTEKSSEEMSLPGQQQSQGSGKLKRTSESNDHEIVHLPSQAPSACSLCHLPYSEASVPFRVDVSKCAICKRAKVPDVLFTTIELPENIPMTGRGVFLQATVCKCKRDLRGELNAKEISDCLPFLEYELHSLLLNKLKVKGMNAIFGLKVQVSVGERLVIGMAVGTAVYLTALPTPTIPKIASGNSWHNDEQLAEIQKNLIETVKKNREFYRLKPIVDIENGRSITTTSDTDESDDDLPDLDLGIGTKDACVLEVDDVEDMDRINLLMDEKPPDDFHVVNTQSIPGLEDLEIVRNLQLFTQISRAKIPAGQFASMPSKYFARMLQTVLFKLRRMVPCALCDMQFKVALPEQDEIQLSVVGMALGLGEPTRFTKYKRKIIPNSTSKDPVKKSEENDLIFNLDEDQVDVATAAQETTTNQPNSFALNSSPLTGVSTQKHRPRSPFRTRSHFQHRHKHVPLKERYGVDISPLSYLPGGKIERYLGNLNFFFIRESTSIRENGGLSGFTHSFVTEVLAIVRAHITALGGNAMVAFFMTQCVLLHSPHKNQGQCLINVGGDIVTVSYYGDDKYQNNQNC